MVYNPDPILDASLHLAEEEAWLAQLPKCSCCGEPITDDYMYRIAGETLCEECMEYKYREAI